MENKANEEDYKEFLGANQRMERDRISVSIKKSPTTSNRQERPPQNREHVICKKDDRIKRRIWVGEEKEN